MNTPILELRPGEWIFWYTSKPDFDLSPGDRLYALATIKTLDFPGPGHPECNKLALICAAIYTTEESSLEAWGWVHLGESTKEDIGGFIMELNLKPGCWHYIIVSSEESYPESRKHAQGTA